MFDSLASNLFAQGSYFFNRVDNENQQIDHRQYLLGGDSISLYDQTSKPTSKNFNNRINTRFDYTADPSNMITILPVLYFQTNRSDNFLNGVTTQNSGGTTAQTTTDALNTGYTLSGHAILGINSIFPIERFLSISALARIRNKLMVFSTRGIGLPERIPLRMILSHNNRTLLSMSTT